MTENIINCYELDIKQDIPVEMEFIKSNNESLKQTNLSFKILLGAIGLGVILFVIYQSSKTRIDEKDKY